MQRRVLTTLAPVLLAAGAVLMVPGTATGQGSYGEFTYLEEESARGTLENLLVPDTASTLGRGGRLFFRCGLGRREVFVSMAADSLATGPLVGRHRFAGDESPTISRWVTDGDGIAAFLPRDAARSFADRAGASDTVTVVFVTPDDGERKFVFPLQGFADGVKQLSCFSEQGDTTG